MFRRKPMRIFAVLSALVLTFSAVVLHAQEDRRGRKYKAPPPTTRIDVTVVRADDKHPINDAAVVFHPVDKDGHDEGNMELKTNEDGKTYIDVIETGSRVLVQVIAHGYQTYGKIYEADKPEIALTIPLHRPVPQYSIYKNHPNQGENQQKPDNSKPQQ